MYIHTCIHTNTHRYFGIREHAMGTMLNGIMYYGLNLASASTFLVRVCMCVYVLISHSQSQYTH